MRAIIRSSRVSDIDRLHPRLRESDVVELNALGSSPLWALTTSFLLSKDYQCWTAEYDGDVQVMWGVAPFPTRDGEGSPWLLASNRVSEFATQFLRESRRDIATMHQLFPTLRNYVHVHNLESIAWLKWCGFAFTRVVPINDTYFIEFEKTNHV